MLVRNRKLGMWVFVIGFILGLIASWIYSLFAKRRAESAVKTPVGSEESAINHVKLPPIELPDEVANPEGIISSSVVLVAEDDTVSVAIVPDDLKRISGIGPKINGLLEEAGIVTFEQLANAKLNVLEGILEKAGPRFRLADPEDWAKQARELMQ